MINNILETKIQFPRLGPAAFQIQYVENCLETDENRHRNHVHDRCEIYIHLEGNVSFVVEDHLYPISPGSIIITRPYEAHHCIYHDGTVHRHYVIRFSGEEYSRFLPFFFGREAGRDNLIILSGKKSAALHSICGRLLSQCDASLSVCIDCLRILDLLQNGEAQNTIEMQATVSTLQTLKYINENLTEPISVATLAEHCLTSVSTLERNFKKDVGTTPSKYILERRLSLSLSYLQGNITIREVSEKCGFSDYSHFIASFRKRFGVTPMQYKKKAEQLAKKP